MEILQRSQSLELISAAELSTTQQITAIPGVMSELFQRLPHVFYMPTVTPVWHLIQLLLSMAQLVIWSLSKPGTAMAWNRSAAHHLLQGLTTPLEMPKMWYFLLMEILPLLLMATGILRLLMSVIKLTLLWSQMNCLCWLPVDLPLKSYYLLTGILPLSLTEEVICMLLMSVFLKRGWLFLMHLSAPQEVPIRWPFLPMGTLSLLLMAVVVFRLLMSAILLALLLQALLTPQEMPKMWSFLPMAILPLLLIGIPDCRLLMSAILQALLLQPLLTL